MKFVQLNDAHTGLPVYINAESVNAVYTDADLRCTAVDVQSGVLFVKEHASTVLNTLYLANYDKGFLFHATEDKDGE